MPTKFACFKINFFNEHKIIMRIPRIYSDQLISLHCDIELNERTAHYLSTVLRMTIAQKIIVFNGDGYEYHGEISSSHKKKMTARFTIQILRNNESPIETRLGLCISKGEKMDYAIQKAVELGVSAIFPLISEYCSVKREGEREEKKHLHLQKVIISSCEQSERNHIPKLYQLQSLKDWVKHETSDLKWVLHPTEHHSDQKIMVPPKSISILIGPEGGFSKKDLEEAIQEGFGIVSLGKRILRTETAPSVILSIIQSKWGDFLT